MATRRPSSRGVGGGQGKPKKMPLNAHSSVWKAFVAIGEAEARKGTYLTRGEVVEICERYKVKLGAIEALTHERWFD